MTDSTDWDTRGFTKLRRISGTIVMEMMGEFPFEADLYRDSGGTVGAVTAQGPRGATWLFVSLTEGGALYTQTAARDGDVEFGGERLVTTASGDRDGVLAAHIAAVGDGARTDIDALDKVLEGAPQAAVRLAEETMKQFVAGLS